MAELPATSISEHFERLTDPRVERSRVHRLVDIVTIALCGAICGADGWAGVETFGREKEVWLREFLELPGGIPSHDTFGRVFARLDPDEFRRCFLRWVSATVGPIGEQSVAIDGKTLRRSHDRQAGKAALHLVSAWATASGMVVGQVATDAKSNEITAIPALMRLLDLQGATVTIDAQGCQVGIASEVVEQGADYVLTLKDNHPKLRERVRLAFVDARAARDAAPHTTTDLAHGRLERRRCLAIGDPEYLAFVDPERRWPSLQSLVLVESTRRVGDTVTTEDRFFLSSRPADADALAPIIRGHWGIENRLHWVLDVVFREDLSRVRVGHAPQNLAILRHFALNLLRQDRSSRASLPTKRFRAALNDSYLRSILDGLSA